MADIATKSVGKAGIRFDYNKLPEQNSATVINRRSVDTLVETMFKLTSRAVETDAKKIQSRNKHIILQNQNF
jgi:hypothetical protein